jgi:glycosyltransferase involved in cell wall biosynthesis
MPVYNAPLHWLNAAIESVRQQVYQEWELCIADDCSPNADVMPYLLAKAQKDSRIKVIPRTINGHISEASNTAIESVTGEFIALLDQDDLLSEDALLSVALAVEAQPNIGMVYSDEDKINDSNLRESPCRKSGWFRADLLKYNCISHLGVYKTSLVRQVGGFRKGYEGAQDHDLALRCSHQLTDSQIVHIPKILYHWRIHPMSTAYMRHAKPYAQTARERTIADYLKTNGLVAFK